MAVTGMSYGPGGNPFAPRPAQPVATGPTAAPGGQWAINNAIPGLQARLTEPATDIIANALRGLPPPNQSKLENAYFGSASGLDPTSDFLRNRGFDLYRTQANQRQQQGMGNLMNLIGTYSGNVAPTPGQELQNQQFGQGQAQQESQFGRNLAQQGSQFGQQMGFEREQWNKQLELLKQYLGDPAGGTGTGSPLASGGNAWDSSMYTNYYQPGNQFGGNTVLPSNYGQMQGANPWAPQPVAPTGRFQIPGQTTWGY